ncbi:hypothetical protein [Thiobacillus sp. 65-1402]|uniref:hypothetical protein n=1 Tax=Thiobacillus sp. 65-1402 TaxID=1895861 RepID=UPI00095ACFD9|nr:hypothetical protein [Thiobacillus sp. 65-1402]OJW75879.1 MAG: hypothetical protein BGO62_07165 [Thiobacillus sp. 65-1402]
MKIAGSDIRLSSQHASVAQHTMRESLRAWIGPERPDFEGRGEVAGRAETDRVSISGEGKAAQESDAVSGAREAADTDPRMQILISMVEALTGEKIRVMSMQELRPSPAPSLEPLPPPGAAGKPVAPRPAGFGIEYARHETRYEAEHTRFQAAGTIRTADGREIVFKLALSMSREHVERREVSVRLGDAVRQVKDPLAINFNGSAAQLGATKFSFDLDNDGSSERISFVAPGSGFLALDKNQDGKINNGGELFGPASGNGFAELAAYDEDGNNWIDENDTVFTQLRVWSKDAQSNDQLATLKAAGVGALYLGKVATEFSHKGADNQFDGQVRASGIYLSEDGSAGSLQQIDLAV